MPSPRDSGFPHTDFGETNMQSVMEAIETCFDFINLSRKSTNLDLALLAAVSNFHFSVWSKNLPGVQASGVCQACSSLTSLLFLTVVLRCFLRLTSSFPGQFEGLLSHPPRSRRCTCVQQLFGLTSLGRTAWKLPGLPACPPLMGQGLQHLRQVVSGGGEGGCEGSVEYCLALSVSS